MRRRARMRRVAAIVATFVLLTTAAGIVTYRWSDGDGLKTGRTLYAHREVLRQIASGQRAGPKVVWVGDSTLLLVPSYPTYPDIITRELLVPNHVESVGVVAPGLDFYAYWSLAGRIAALHPSLVVLVANLRNFVPEGRMRGYSDLMAEISVEDLPRTLALPYYVRGMSAPRLLLARALRTPLGNDVFLTLEGARRNVQDAGAWQWLGPLQPARTPAQLFERFVAVADQKVADFDRPIGPGNPLVRFAGATVARLVESGSAVLVVVTPVPWERGLETHHYEEGRFAARIAVLRDAVEANGGQLLDLHRAIARNEFRDADCHFTAAGANTMARLVDPEVRRLLGRAIDAR